MCRICEEYFGVEERVLDHRLKGFTKQKISVNPYNPYNLWSNLLCTNQDIIKFCKFVYDTIQYYKNALNRNLKLYEKDS